MHDHYSFCPSLLLGDQLPICKIMLHLKYVVRFMLEIVNVMENQAALSHSDFSTFKLLKTYKSDEQICYNFLKLKLIVSAQDPQNPE